jgi:hypothetical protein
MAAPVSFSRLIPFMASLGGAVVLAQWYKGSKDPALRSLSRWCGLRRRPPMESMICDTSTLHFLTSPLVIGAET